jgi:hypothetical protein
MGNASTGRVPSSSDISSIVARLLLENFLELEVPPDEEGLWDEEDEEGLDEDADGFDEEVDEEDDLAAGGGLGGRGLAVGLTPRLYALGVGVCEFK